MLNKRDLIKLIYQLSTTTLFQLKPFLLNCNKSCSICCNRQENQRIIFFIIFLLVEINEQNDNWLTANPVQNYDQGDLLLKSGASFQLRQWKNLKNVMIYGTLQYIHLKFQDLKKQSLIF